MINLESIKVLLMTAGISRMKIEFDDEQQCVKGDYIFRGESHTSQITYQEIIDSLTIGLPEPTQGSTVALNVAPVDEHNQLR